MAPGEASLLPVEGARRPELGFGEWNGGAERRASGAECLAEPAEVIVTGGWRRGSGSMSRSCSLFESKAWTALNRESALVRHLIGAGVTALGKANYADRKGEYYTAFFGLSVGIERLSKLIIVANSALKEGVLPSEKIIRKFSHRIGELNTEVEGIERDRSIATSYGRPNHEVCVRIMSALDAFADASRGRYANFAALGNPNLDAENEPVKKWWGDVAECILQHHYYGKAVEHRSEILAGRMDSSLSRFFHVLHQNEAGQGIYDLKAMGIQSAKVTVIQRYGRYYSLKIVRWLADIFSQLCKIAVESPYKMDFFCGHWELFDTYVIADDFLKKRKIWPLER